MQKKITLGNGVEGLFIKNTRFNTTLVSFNFYLPLTRENYAENSLLPYVLTSCSEEYGTFRELNTALGNLYGASVSAGSAKLMNYQRINISISVLNDRYSLDGDSVVSRAASLLASLIFAPSIESDAFKEQDIERERRQMLDRIYGEINDKRGYARAKTLELLFGDDPYGIPRFGTESDMKNVTQTSLFEAWSNMLKKAYVRINVIGESEETADAVFSAATAGFSSITREDVTSFNGFNIPVFAEKTEQTERMDITQGKLVMAFTTGVVDCEKNTAALTVMADIFGGGPYSKLFMNVREKLSLCYYCACGIVKNKGFMLVDSGLEEQNADKAKNEILRQLECMQNGEITDSEIEASIRSICDSAKSVYDSEEGINAWYSARVFDDSVSSPEEFAELIKRVTKEDVCRAARGLSLNTVYMLMPQEEK